ncbi:MAG: hypothetical protein KBF93_20050 [Leptospiraceae bacterium]|nr:hypothetical protein [Leptospiraceae bacterium]
MRNKNLTAIHKFYFLEYFDILLKSIQFSREPNIAFTHFIGLKDKKKLGESRYKKNVQATESMSNLTLHHYWYTFQEVIEESAFLGLIEKDRSILKLTSLGNKLLLVSSKGSEKFNHEIFLLMESRLQGFRYLIEASYLANPENNGLLIFPVYSPLKLGMNKQEIVSSNNIREYAQLLREKIEIDIEYYLSQKISLDKPTSEIIKKIEHSGLLEMTLNSNGIAQNYNKIVKRIRDFWVNYFLQFVYKIDLSLSYFELWVYRGKQLGIINANEFYPGFNGKIVYPTSLLMKEKAHSDFKKLFTYKDDTSLYAHTPKWVLNQHEFVNVLFNSYHDIKSRSKSYFINLADLRDMVCFKMKISESVFSDFLKKAYTLNLRDVLKIKISLESDTLPEENKAIYLKREPVIIGGKQKNIIAIELKK